MATCRPKLDPGSPVGRPSQPAPVLEMTILNLGSYRTISSCTPEIFWVEIVVGGQDEPNTILKSPQGQPLVVHFVVTVINSQSVPGDES